MLPIYNYLVHVKCLLLKQPLFLIFFSLFLRSFNPYQNNELIIIKQLLHVWLYLTV